MRYVINNNVFKTPHDVRVYIVDHSGEKYFKEMLNEKYGHIEICGKNYLASHILRKLSPLTYQCEKDNFYNDNVNGIGNDIEKIIENMNEFDTVYLYDFKIVSIPY